MNMSLEKLMDESGIYPLKLEGLKEIIISLVLRGLSDWKICYGKICYEFWREIQRYLVANCQLFCIMGY